MHFELYTTKTVKQCSQELNNRFLEKDSRSRPAIGGFVEKGGAFNLTTSTPVLGLRRTTRLRATMEKNKDTTVIKGYVSEGVQKEKVYIVMGALGFVALTLILKQQAVFGVIVGIVAIMAYIPLVGDDNNSQYLLRELKRLTGAKDKPPASILPAAKTTTKTTRAVATSAKPRATTPRTTSTKTNGTRLTAARPKAAATKKTATPARPKASASRPTSKPAARSASSSSKTRTVVGR